MKNLNPVFQTLLAPFVLGTCNDCVRCEKCVSIEASLSPFPTLTLKEIGLEDDDLPF